MKLENMIQNNDEWETEEEESYTCTDCIEKWLEESGQVGG